MSFFLPISCVHGSLAPQCLASAAAQAEQFLFHGGKNDSATHFTFVRTVG